MKTLPLLRDNARPHMRTRFSAVFALVMALALLGVGAPHGRLVAFADDSSSTPSSTVQTDPSTAPTGTIDATPPTDTSDPGNATDTSITTPPAPTSTSGTTDTADTGNDISLPSSTVSSTIPDASSTLPTSTPDLTLPTDTTPDSTADIVAPPGPDTPADQTGVAPSDAPTPTSIIVTGNAAAAANVVNVVGTNIVDSSGFYSLLNLFEPYLGNIDLSQLNFQPTGDCSSCTGGSLSVNNTNVSAVTNNVSVTADTGGNSADAGGGDATVLTGNADAAANVVNVVNTNIVKSNYLLLVLNNFNQMTGDIILPGAAFFENFLDGANANGADGATTITNANQADVSNTDAVAADTGNNTSTGGATNFIGTGNAVAASNALNLVNSNITANDQVYILVRVFGNWNGSVFSAPPGISWQPTSDGVALTGSGTEGILAGGHGATSVDDVNTANVTNNVQVYALTGNNEANGGGNNAIATGDAAAVGNTVNIINTNIVGHNLLLALVNVFGDWQGNLAFGQPNLWVGAQADVSANPLGPNGIVTYTVTLANHGTADATNVHLTASHDSNLVNIINPGSGTEGGDGSLGWTIPTVPAGATMSFMYEEQVSEALPMGPSTVTENFNATEHEDDANPANGNDSVSLVVNGAPFGNGGRVSHLIVTESNNTETSTFQPGKDAQFNITVSDAPFAGPVDNVIANETFYDPYDNVVSTSTWPLGYMEPGDEYDIAYSTYFPASTHTGWFMSKVTLSGNDMAGNIWQTKDLVATSSIYVVNPNDNKQAPPPLVFIVPPPPLPPPVIKRVSNGTSTAPSAFAAPQPPAAPSEGTSYSPITDVTTASFVTNFTASIGMVFGMPAFHWDGLRNFFAGIASSFPPKMSLF